MSRALEYCREMILSLFSQNGRRWPFWMSEIHFRFHFSPFQIKTQLSFFLLKMAAGSHFGCPKLIFVCISGHFRSKCNFHFFFTKWPPAAILDVQNSFSFAFLVISDENATFIFFLKMAAGGHFGCPKLIFVCISRFFSPFSFAIHHLR